MHLSAEILKELSDTNTDERDDNQEFQCGKDNKHTPSFSQSKLNDLVRNL